MPTPQEIMAAIDTRLAGQWPALAAAQEQIRAERGRYAQLPPLARNTPADGLLVAPDNLDASYEHTPGDTWRALATKYGAALPGSVGSNLEVHHYDGPAGPGYEVRITVRIAGRLWRRIQQVGPEAWREQAWQQVG